MHYLLLLIPLIAPITEAHDQLYEAVVTKVYDGDTITLSIPLGFNNVLVNQKVRLYGINAPELKGETKPQGLKSRDFLSSKVLNKTILLKVVKLRGKYGRIIGEIYLPSSTSSTSSTTSINQLLVDKNLAVPYMR